MGGLLGIEKAPRRAPPTIQHPNLLSALAMPRVTVIGAGHTRFGRRPDATVQQLAFDALREALQDAGIEKRRVDGVAAGSVPEYHKQRSLSGAISTHLILKFMTEHVSLPK